jgi:hypothetical protein
MPKKSAANARPAAPVFFLATLDTRHETFEGAGLTEQAARSAIKAAWTIHKAQLERLYPNAAVNAWSVMASRVVISEFRAGVGYRDHFPLTCPDLTKKPQKDRKSDG